MILAILVMLIAILEMVVVTSGDYGGGDDGYGLVTFLGIGYFSGYLPRFEVNLILVGLDFQKFRPMPRECSSRVQWTKFFENIGQPKIKLNENFGHISIIHPDPLNRSF